jgi:ABC-type multidrug transport system ATPase subunit
VSKILGLRIKKDKINFSDETILQIKDLRKSYGFPKKKSRKVILNSIDMELKKGECLCVVGENGVGKSTLLKIIIGLIAKDGGEIHINGSFGYVPETSINFQSLSAEENLLYYDNMSAQSSNYVGLLSQMGISEAKKRKMKYFSKGMSRKVDIIRALNNNPALIILDEPFEGLDPKTCSDIIEILKKMKESGKGILMSSHDMTYVERIADNIFLLEKGKMTQLSRNERIFHITFECENIDPISKKIKEFGLEAVNSQNKYHVAINDESIKNEVIKYLIDCGAKIIKQQYQSLEEEYLETIQRSE